MRTFLFNTAELFRLRANIAGATLKVPQIPKRGKMTCWAGCYRMLDSWRNGEATGKSICAYIRLLSPSHSCSCFIEPSAECDQPRRVTAITGDLVKLEFTVTPLESSLSVPEIRDSIKSSTALLVYRDQSHLGLGIGHFLIVSGWRLFPLSGIKLRVNDPDSEATRYEDLVDFSAKNGHWRNTWGVAK